MDCACRIECEIRNQIASEFAADGQPYAVFVDNNLGSIGPIYGIYVIPSTPEKDLERGRFDRRHRRYSVDPLLWRSRDARECSSDSSHSQMKILWMQERKPRRRPTMRGGSRLLHENGIQVNGGRSCWASTMIARTCSLGLPLGSRKTACECATFHILTPYPATPLFRQMESENRLLHRDWDLYDTAHAVFRPKQMSADELEQGYAWMYERVLPHVDLASPALGLARACAYLVMLTGTSAQTASGIC